MVIFIIIGVNEFIFYFIFNNFYVVMVVESLVLGYDLIIVMVNDVDVGF